MNPLAKPFRAALAASFGVPALCALASAQQFQHQVGMIPGTPRWTEGVECADVDLDGDLDIFFADGDGYSSAGTKRQNVLIVNKLIETASLSFADESVTRLGAHVSNGKGVTTGDIDADGWVDALFSNAFNTDPAFLYVNQGAANPGFFTFDGVARGFTTNIAAGGAMFSDVDDDGDLDVVINNNYVGSGSGVPRLYLNDGSGMFSLTAGAFSAAPAKSAHMDVQMIDIDADWKVDFFGANRATNGTAAHFLMTNNGQGVFADQSALLPATSGNVYEADVSDLDNDQDIDLFFVSISGFAEGMMRNDLLPTGPLGFTKGGNLGGDDDNEVAYLDFDMDGDLDSFVGSLGAREKLWRNDGSMVFTSSHTSITAVADSTLDMTVADLNNDGRYDLITAQGESNPGQWANKVYLNVSGPVDNVAPEVTAIQSRLNTSQTSEVVVQAKVSDQVMDDGVDYLAASAEYVALAAPVSVNVSITGGGFSPAVSNISPGTSIVFANNSGVTQSVTSTTAPYAYDVSLLAGQSYEHFFVAAGTYDFKSNPSGLTGSAVVSGATSVATGLKAGIGQYRFGMTNSLGGGGTQLVYELSFRDWAGNETVTENGVIGLVDCNLANYCTSKPSSVASCTPTLSAVGTPSSSAGSGFVVTAGATPGGNSGLFIYTVNGAQAVPISNPYGFVCISTTGLFRIAPQVSPGSPAVCDGQYTIDFNAYYATQTLDPNLVSGSQVDLQCWYRDPPNTGGANLTNAGRFYMCP